LIEEERPTCKKLIFLKGKIASNKNGGKETVKSETEKEKGGERVRERKG
jgi:hypothetical protein